jgi:hypothetical protein
MLWPWDRALQQSICNDDWRYPWRFFNVLFLTGNDGSRFDATNPVSARLYLLARHRVPKTKQYPR